MVYTVALHICGFPTGGLNSTGIYFKNPHISTQFKPVFKGNYILIWYTSFWREDSSVQICILCEF